MVREMVRMRIRPETLVEFLPQLKLALAILDQAEGHLGHSLYSCMEDPGQLLLEVRWRTDHTEKFVPSPAFSQMRQLISPFQVAPSEIFHYVAVDF